MEPNNTEIQHYLNQPGVKISLAVTFLSVFLFFVTLLGIEIKSDFLAMLYVFSLIIEFFYGVILTFKIIKNRRGYSHLVPFLFLNWFIGCFCTNVLINIFENLPVWVYVTTFLFCISNFFIYNNLKNKIASAAYFANGFSFLLIVYFTFYLLPIMPFSVLGTFFLGLGFYGLVPFIVTLSHTITMGRILPNNKAFLMPFFSGMAIVLIALATFTLKLNAESNHITANSPTKTFETNNDLPSYVIISQRLDPNFFNEILLKKGIVYVGTDHFLSMRSFNSFGMKQYNERKNHNPFINVAYFFANDLFLSDDDKIKILESNFDKRLETEEQLWSSDGLATKNIKEDVKIYANNRIAYTEITMDVACTEESWGDKEAIYSFQLPEGSVATSLSLWVNGVERKGVLTTKEKAAQAYKQIVSVEARDPSLMQWREGNRVVVRVFPIRQELPRTFKCGFTTPLQVENNQMKYQSLAITGPEISQAQTLSRIQVDGSSKLETSKDFALKNGFYTNESEGLEAWEAILPVKHDAFSNAFSWKNKVYEIKKPERETIAFMPSELVLDLNSSWTLDELKTITANNRKYAVYLNNKKQLLGKDNYGTIFGEFESLHYSLLPLYKLQPNSLVITKCGNFSANFEELGASEYLLQLKANTKSKNLKVINISEGLTPFWQTVKEQKYVEYLKTDLKTALKLIEKRQFVTLKTGENLVNIEPAEMAIQQSEKTNLSLNNGSTHLYRMYAFGKVLEEQVKIQSDSTAVNQYVDLAKDANIVTPITSLIVLETDEDYKNNGIEKNEGTLGNATINDTTETNGDTNASPIPNQWIIALLGFVLAFFYYRKKAI